MKKYPPKYNGIMMSLPNPFKQGNALLRQVSKNVEKTLNAFRPTATLSPFIIQDTSFSGEFLTYNGVHYFFPGDTARYDVTYKAKAAGIAEYIQKMNGSKKSGRLKFKPKETKKKRVTKEITEAHSVDCYGEITPKKGAPMAFDSVSESFSVGLMTYSLVPVEQYPVATGNSYVNEVLPAVVLPLETRPATVHEMWKGLEEWVPRTREYLKKNGVIVDGSFSLMDVIEGPDHSYRYPDRSAQIEYTITIENHTNKGIKLPLAMYIWMNYADNKRYTRYQASTHKFSVGGDTTRKFSDTMSIPSSFRGELFATSKFLFFPILAQGIFELGELQPP